MNYKQIIAIDNKNKKMLLQYYPKLSDISGIYILTREAYGFKYAYIGQSEHILTRLVEHLRGWQHIDLSLKNHKLYSEKNTEGWKIDFIEYDVAELNSKEQEYIKKYADMGYQLRNKTAGGQSVGKKAINDYTVNKYRKGVNYGYNKAKEEISNYFKKYLDVKIKGKPNKIKERKYQEFINFLGVDDGVKKD